MALTAPEFKCCCASQTLIFVVFPSRDLCVSHLLSCSCPGQTGAGCQEAEGGPTGQPAGGAGPAQPDRLTGQRRALDTHRAGPTAAGERTAAEQVSGAAAIVEES